MKLIKNLWCRIIHGYSLKDWMELERLNQEYYTSKQEFVKIQKLYYGGEMSYGEFFHKSLLHLKSLKLIIDEECKIYKKYTRAHIPFYD